MGLTCAAIGFMLGLVVGAEGSRPDPVAKYEPNLETELLKLEIEHDSEVRVYRSNIQLGWTCGTLNGDYDAMMARMEQAWDESLEDQKKRLRLQFQGGVR